MGWRMYSRTEITGPVAVLQKIADLIRSDELFKKFNTVRFCLPEISKASQADRGCLQVLLSTRKEAPIEFFEFCESLGCHVLANTDHESAAFEQGQLYDSDLIREDHQAELEHYEGLLAEAREQVERIDPATDAPDDSSKFSLGGLRQAQVETYRQKIAELQKKIAGEVWDQALDE